MLTKIRDKIYKKLSGKEPLKKGLELKAYYEVISAIEDLKDIRTGIEDEINGMNMALSMDEDERETYCLDQVLDPEYMRSVLNDVDDQITKVCDYLEWVLGIK